MKLPRRQISASGRGRCRAADVVADREAQAYPSRPVRWIVAAGPGSSPEIVARLIEQPLSKQLGQPIVIDNRPGGGNKHRNPGSRECTSGRLYASLRHQCQCN